MSLEHIRAIEALLGRTARPWTEAADHGSFVMCQGVTILVVFPCKAFGVVFACRDRTFLRTLILVCEHVRLEIFEVPAARRVWAEAFVGFIR